MGSATRYFRRETLLFTFSKMQRDFLADPPDRIEPDAGKQVHRTATVLARNGLISVADDLEQRITVTDAGRAAVAFYDTLRGVRTDYAIA